ncbi:hypothetical protein OG897_03895 [Streptomyces sp. NBC_00237]|uniref:hypothetical protein n=1 Tax=Streptomyces sp. NBC_00237 TaxID=2975687 RepID=UPI002252DEAB|nr:hypothetical protein [Streptomyces sp. NBC_00237]MCX5200608.1 hypothetical protein [Streptomyces sp. NBC_00237]
MPGDVTLPQATAAVLDVWEALVASGEMSAQSLSRFGQLLGRFERLATVRGAVLLADVSAQIAGQFVDAHGRTRHGRTAPAVLATRHLRRSVLRMFFTTARELCLTDTDPTHGLTLPSRTTGETRPLAEDEAVALRRAAEFVQRPTRHAAAAALALAGAFSGEIGHIRGHDLDVPGRRVWLHGSTKTAPRFNALDDWGLRVLTARTAHLTAGALPGQDPGGLPLVVSARAGSDEQVQARVCVALRDLIKRIGLGADPAVRPASITAYAGWEHFTSTHRIESVARHLGMGSLDSAAALIGHRWQHADPPAADGGLAQNRHRHAR